MNLKTLKKLTVIVALFWIWGTYLTETNDAIQGSMFAREAATNDAISQVGEIAAIDLSEADPWLTIWANHQLGEALDEIGDALDLLNGSTDSAAQNIDDAIASYAEAVELQTSDPPASMQAAADAQTYAMQAVDRCSVAEAILWGSRARIDAVKAEVEAGP